MENTQTKILHTITQLQELNDIITIKKYQFNENMGYMKKDNNTRKIINIIQILNSEYQSLNIHVQRIILDIISHEKIKNIKDYIQNKSIQKKTYKNLSNQDKIREILISINDLLKINRTFKYLWAIIINNTNQKYSEQLDWQLESYIKIIINTKRKLIKNFLILEKNKKQIYNIINTN